MCRVFGPRNQRQGGGWDRAPGGSFVSSSPHALVMFTAVRLALVMFTAVRFAAVKSTPLRCAAVRSASLRFAPLRFVFGQDRSVSGSPCSGPPGQVRHAHVHLAQVRPG